MLNSNYLFRMIERNIKMNNKILIVTEYYYPNHLTTSNYLTKISEVLSLENEIKVICNIDLKKNNELEFIRGRIIRIKENKLNKNKFLSRMFQLLYSSFQLTWTTFISVHRGDHIFSVTNPAFLILVLPIIAKIKNCEYTLLVYDVFPENTVAAGVLKKTSFFYKIVKKMFDWAYSRADKLIVIGRDMEEVIGAKTNYKVPIQLITNWCDTEKIYCMEKCDNSIIKSLKLEDKIVFSFAGNLGQLQGVQNLLEAAKLVDHNKFILLFIGIGAKLPLIEKHIEEYPEGNVVYGGSYPPSDQNLFLNACDVSIVSLDNSMYGLGVPSKSYYNMAAAKPLLFIGEQLSEIGRVVSEHDIGWVVSPNNPEKLAEKIEEICKNEKYEYKGKKAKDVVEQFYSEKVIMQKYRELYKSQK